MLYICDDQSAKTVGDEDQGAICLRGVSDVPRLNVLYKMKKENWVCTARVSALLLFNCKNRSFEYVSNRLSAGLAHIWATLAS